MTETPSRRRLLEQAHDLAGRLDARETGKDHVRRVLETLAHTSGTWSERLQTAREILDLSTTSWPRHRSGSAPAQLKAVKEEVSPLLDGSLSEGDLHFVLGWAARLLQVREKGWPKEQTDPMSETIDEHSR